LILSCRLVAAPHLGMQIYWRLVRDEAARATGLEAIVSAQTELLDSDPAATVASLLPPGDVLTLADDDRTFQPLASGRGEAAPGNGELATARGAVLIRFERGKTSFLEMVHPSDDRGATFARADEQVATCYPVLTERLEKGVIRRSRVRALFLPRDNDDAVAAALYRQFAASPAPLTA